MMGVQGADPWQGFARGLKRAVAPCLRKLFWFMLLAWLDSGQCEKYGNMSVYIKAYFNVLFGSEYIVNGYYICKWQFLGVLQN